MVILEKSKLEDRYKLLQMLQNPTAVVNAHGDVRAANDAFSALLSTNISYEASVFGETFKNCHNVSFHSWVLDQEFGSTKDSRTIVLELDDATQAFSICPFETGSQNVEFLIERCSLCDADIRLQYLLRHLEHGIWDYDVSKEIFNVTNAWKRMRGFNEKDDVNEEDPNWLNDIHPEDREDLQGLFEGQIAGESRKLELQYRRWHRIEKRWVWILCQAGVMQYSSDGKPRHIVGTDTDITELKRVEFELKQLHNKTRLAIAASEMGLFEFDYAKNKVFWDDRMLEIYGVKDRENEREGDYWASRIHPDDLAETLSKTEQVQVGVDLNADYRILRTDGETRYIRSKAQFIPDAGDKGMLIGVNIDVTDDVERSKELEQMREKLVYESRHDSLTGLANRRLLDAKLDEISASMDDNEHVGILSFDLDHFKAANDRFGHAVGDDLLRQAATLLAELCGEKMLVCRLGGDEFVALSGPQKEKPDFADLAATIIRRFSSPFSVGDHYCKIGVSVGSAVVSGKELNKDALLVEADRALYAAKAAGRNCFRELVANKDLETPRHDPKRPASIA
ncbi:hypothetical protein GCM10007879_24030 [Maritalea porphyrae]|uniref:Diguanylate cyclase n=1 Tax=Maritalea porphyrae TaxID=880732 RepID=A0ABQ5USB0_9HYPH|nr:hypothetical protein GCM10007879_24030 [Maritalea porphyrae]